jgi:preprotein translocase subunit SecY
MFGRSFRRGFAFGAIIMAALEALIWANDAYHGRDHPGLNPIQVIATALVVLTSGVFVGLIAAVMDKFGRGRSPD